MDYPFIPRTNIHFPRGLRLLAAIHSMPSCLIIPIHNARLTEPFRLESEWSEQSFERIACLRRKSFGHVYAASDFLSGGYESQIVL